LSARHLGSNHCDGQLTFATNAFSFNCSQETFTIERNAVAKVDKNGVKLASGKRYHFNVAGYDKDGVNDLFRNWLAR
jgi:hypothetical protein